MFGDRKKPAQFRAIFLRRISILAFFCLFGIGMLISRVCYLTLVKGHDLYILSEENFLRLEKIPAPRGPIEDRFGRQLATSEARFDITASPFNISPFQLDQTLREVEKLCPKIKNVNRDEIANLRPRWREKTLATNLTLTEILPLSERLGYLPGLQIVQTFERAYPFGRMAAHLIGYVTKISPKKMDDYLEMGYDRNDIIGSAGLERKNEDYLKGVKGVQITHRDAWGRLLFSKVNPSDKSVKGYRTVLTLDIDMQTSATLLLQGRTGAIVALDPNNGDVLTLASNPTYDSNNPVIKPGSGDSQYNKALQEHYAPGSTFKIVPAITFLQNGGSVNRTINCTGLITVFPGFVRKCDIYKYNHGGHGALNFFQAVEKSCNAYFFQLAKELPADDMVTVASKLGFGQVTGIGLPESPGVLGNPGSPAFRGANKVMFGIGQGELISVTPMQLAVAYSVIANGGKRYTPRLIRETDFPDGPRFPPAIVQDQLSWTPQQREMLLEGLRQVVESKSGTGRHAGFDPEQKVAGKTGTAQRGKKEADAWFACFSPWDKPEIVVVVMMEEAGHGGETAAPIAKKILDAYYLIKKQRAAQQPPAQFVSPAPSEPAKPVEALQSHSSGDAAAPSDAASIPDL